jgi:hypothetical protein
MRHPGDGSGSTVQLLLKGPGDGGAYPPLKYQFRMKDESAMLTTPSLFASAWLRQGGAMPPLKR